MLAQFSLPLYAACFVSRRALAPAPLPGFCYSKREERRTGGARERDEGEREMESVSEWTFSLGARRAVRGRRETEARLLWLAGCCFILVLTHRHLAVASFWH